MSANSPANQQPIAIVGVSALFPGSTNAQGFWRDILAGRDLMREVPESHWLIDDYYDPNPAAVDKTYAKRGAFLDPINFDALGWGVPPATIPATDTSQLLALVLAQTVLQDAAREQFESMDRSRISVILGVTSAQDLLSTMVSRLQRPVWVKALRETGLPEPEVQAACERIAAHYVPWQESSFPGLLGNVVAGRVANRLNLGGTNCVTDAACASSFSALSMAVNELQLGHSDLVISGGVDTLNDIFMYMCFSKTPALSPSGDCRPFSDQADGTMLGEGVGMVALKRLSDAERDGDRIYAVVRGVGTSSDGRAKSVYAPVPEGQAQALRRAYALAGYGPETVELVEAHGTGTKAGDAAEFEGLRMVFSAADATRKQWCALGSVKSQIGHTKAAAGAAGLFKAIMALHHQVLPPSIKIAAPNPKLAISESPFYLNTKARPWIRNTQHPRRASVSAFGFGGSNFHIALEEYLGPGKRAERYAPEPYELFVLAAPNPRELAELVRVAASSELPLALLARQSQQNWQHAHARLSIVASSTSELSAKLLSAAQRIESAPEQSFALPDGSAYGVGAPSGKLALLFPGQGSHYVGMGEQLAMHFPLAQAVWNEAAEQSWDAQTTLQDVVFPRPGFTNEAATEQAARLTQTPWAQPAIGCAALAQWALLRDLALTPDMLGGHSFGELTALHVAGSFSAPDFLAIARKRGELMAVAGTEPGAMSALRVSEARARELIAQFASCVVLANHNAPNQVVVSGSTAAIAQFEQQIQSLDVVAQRLSVGNAFHSSLVAGSCAPFADFLNGIAFAPAQVPVYSNAQAAVYPDDPAALRRGLAEQIASPVRFVEMLEAMYADGARTFVEVGPGSTLSGLVGATLAGRAHTALSLDRKGKDGVQTLLRGLGSLLSAGFPLQLARLYAPFRAPEVSAAASKASLPIHGSNYGKLYPPVGGSAALPLPNPARAPEVKTAVAQPSVPLQDTLLAPFKRPSEAIAIKPNHPPASPIAVPEANSSWLSAFQESQQQTAAAHSAFQQAMFASHAQYLQMAESALHGLRELAGAAPADARVMAPAMLSYAQPLPPVAPLAPAQLAPVQRAAPAPAPVVIVAPPVPVARLAQAPLSEPAPAVAAPRDLQALMLAVVAEKTGYPVDMLNLDMDLEGDLGIDSIKRVEILAAVDERAPELPKADRNQLSGMHTLRQIVGYLQSIAPNAPPPTPALAPPIASQTPANAAPADLQALMLSIVAEKTGYPVDMLNLDMDLEGDLGIDSIKRVEILAAFDERAPGAAKPGRAELAGLHTLREIVRALQDGSTPPAVAAPATALPVLASPLKPALGRYAVQLIAAPAAGLAQVGLLGGGEVWITGEDQLAEALAAELQARGVNAYSCTALPAHASACIYLGGLRAVQDAQQAIAVNQQAFALARQMAARLEHAPGLLVTVQDTGGSFGIRGIDLQRAWLSGLPALLKTAALEWPQAALKAIDLECAGRSPQVLAVALADELLLGGGEIEVALPAAGGRFTLRCIAQPAPAGTPVLKPSDVVLVSGGARGVTAACMQAWAQSSPAHFVLLGRTELAPEPAAAQGAHDEAALKTALLRAAQASGESLSPLELLGQVRQVLADREVRNTLVAISQTGAQARYESVDVSDLKALNTVLERVRSEWGPITAVVHAAGVLADKAISGKTDAQFAHVFDTKVQGLRALLAATENDPLKLLCVFSSVSARCGNTGQSDYAMANEVLAKVASAQAQLRPGLLVKSLAWGPWEGGMVNPQLKQRFAELGVPMLPLEVGAAMFVAEMRSAAPAHIDTETSSVEWVLGGEPRAEALLQVGAETRVQQLELNVRRESHAYLEGHAVHGVPVVPVVLVAEWLARAARSFRPGLVLHALHDLQVLKGIRLPGFENGGDRLIIQATTLADVAGAASGDQQLQLRVRDSHGTLHYSARAELKAQARVGDRGLPELDTQAWHGAPLYQDLLFHRGKFELIESLDGISDHGAGATLRGVSQAGWQPEAWHFDVAALDAGLQLAVLYGQRMLGGANLPTAIAEIRHFGLAPSDGLLTAAAYARKVGNAAVTTDILFSDAQGQRVAELRGVQNHALPRA